MCGRRTDTPPSHEPQLQQLRTRSTGTRTILLLPSRPRPIRSRRPLRQSLLRRLPRQLPPLLQKRKQQSPSRQLRPVPRTTRQPPPTRRKARPPRLQMLSPRPISRCISRPRRLPRSCVREQSAQSGLAPILQRPMANRTYPRRRGSRPVLPASARSTTTSLKINSQPYSTPHCLSGRVSVAVGEMVVRRAGTAVRRDGRRIRAGPVAVLERLGRAVEEAAAKEVVGAAVAMLPTRVRPATSQRVPSSPFSTTLLSVRRPRHARSGLVREGKGGWEGYHCLLEPWLSRPSIASGQVPAAVL